MVGIFGRYAGEFLYVIAVGTLLLFGLPIFCWPLTWARVLRWRIPEHTDLAVYFGRCLGGVIIVISFFAFRAAGNTSVQPFYFDLIIANLIVLIAVHIYGAIKKIQPLSETIEIAYWLLLAILTLLFYPQHR